MDKKFKKIMLIVIAVFVIIVLFLFLMSLPKKRYSAEELESKIIDKAKNYFTQHQSELPNKGNIKTLSLSDLTNMGIIDELDKILDKNTSCAGSLIIENNNDYYMYSPNLNCSTSNNNYVTKNLKETLLKNVVNSGNGLYTYGNSFLFRGDNVNNYIILDGILWRITKINEDGSIRLIEATRRSSVVWDNRYNSDKLMATGYNSYVYNGINSRIKDSLDQIYNDDSLFSDDGKAYIKETNLCIGKRSEKETINDGSIECSEILENQYLGLLQLNEFLLASLDYNCINSTSSACNNYNYLAALDTPYWTLTGSSENNYQVFKISGTAFETNAVNSGMARLVINISQNTNVTGSGTKDDPYIVLGFNNTLKDK